MKLRLFHNNEPLSWITHFIGALLSVAGLVLMVVFASLKGNVWHIVGFSVFGTCMVLLYMTSALYHFFPKKTRIKSTFRRLDHSMIYVLIAGTYTPVCLLMPQRGWAWSLFGLIWFFAVAGVVIKTTGIKIPPWASLGLYLVMGWMALIALKPLIEWLSPDGMTWLFLGGALYTFGCIFFALDVVVPRTKWFGMHEIFHLFVIGGTLSHFFLMFTLL